MLLLIGFVLVVGCVAFGYGAHGGNFKVLWQPFEVIIIFGAAAGAAIIANPGHVLKGMGTGIKKLLGGSPYHKDDYVELLSFLFNICKIMKTKGMLEVEGALDNPGESELFTAYPKVLGNHHAVDFFCDTLRIVVMGMDDHYQLEDLMEKEIEIHHHEGEEIAGAVATIADGLPALGIVAAVLGVITTMGSITEPPEVLGGLIGAALVGTFLGVLVGYGFVGPMATSLGKYADAETEYFKVLKTAILAHVQGNAPQITVEFARSVIPGHDRPSFEELDQVLNGPSPD